MLPFSRFPSLPVEVVSSLPPQDFSVPVPFSAFYFANCVKSAPENVLIRYDVAFLLRWAHNVAAALTLDIKAHASVWRCSLEGINFLERFASPDNFFFVEAVNRFVVPVSCRSVTGKLRRVHEFLLTNLTSLRD